MLELVQRSLADDERPESVVKSAIGLVGDLADTFPNGQIKQNLLAEWLASALRSKPRYSNETRLTFRWARDVSTSQRFDVSTEECCRQMVKRATA